MKTLVLTLFLATSTFAQQKDVVKSYDKFTGVTTVSLKKPISLLSNLSTHLQMVVSSLREKDLVGMAFVCTSPDDKFRGGADVFVIAGGERIQLGHFRLTNWELGEGGPIVFRTETIAGAVERQVFERIVRSNYVEIKVGELEAKLKDDRLKHLRAFRQQYTRRTKMGSIRLSPCSSFSNRYSTGNILIGLLRFLAVLP